jgi:hypothetical protein
MIVVADTGPLNYLVLLGVVDVLEPLYNRVLVPETVAGKLQAEVRLPSRPGSRSRPNGVRSVRTLLPTRPSGFSIPASALPSHLRWWSTWIAS